VGCEGWVGVVAGGSAHRLGEAWVRTEREGVAVEQASVPCFRCWHTKRKSSKLWGAEVGGAGCHHPRVGVSERLRYACGAAGGVRRSPPPWWRQRAREMEAEVLGGLQDRGRVTYAPQPTRFPRTAPSQDCSWWCCRDVREQETGLVPSSWGLPGSG
jgi:hypothetical protein